MTRLRRCLVWLSVTAWVGGFAASAAAAPQFPQCPTVGGDTGCQYLITINRLGAVSLGSDPSQPSYANNLTATHETGTPTDALIGVQNDSSVPISSLTLSGPITFEFDGDGICANASGPVPNGCRTPAGSTACGVYEGPCSFAPPPGEPAGYTEFGAPPGMPAWANGDVQNGYEGPTVWFSNVAPSPNNSGTVNFSPAVAPGGSAYFALEAPPKNLPFTTYVVATQTAGGATGAVLYLPRGVSVRSSAQLSGGNGHLGGNVTFQLFHDGGCSASDISAGTSAVSSPSLVSNAMLLNGSGTYFWQAQYGGDGTNAPSVTDCGARTVVVPQGGNVGLPASGRCLSVMAANLRFGHHPVRTAEVFANGKLLGTFGAKIRLRIRKRERVAVIVSSASRAFARGLTDQRLFRQESRTYKAC